MLGSRACLGSRKRGCRENGYRQMGEIRSCLPVGLSCAHTAARPEMHPGAQSPSTSGSGTWVKLIRMGALSRASWTLPKYTTLRP